MTFPINHPISPTCIGEKCRICSKPAAHKVAEEISWDDPSLDSRRLKLRHEYTAYICCDHFSELFGSWTHIPEHGSEVAG